MARLPPPKTPEVSKPDETVPSMVTVTIDAEAALATTIDAVATAAPASGARSFAAQNPTAEKFVGLRMEEP